MVVALWASGGMVCVHKRLEGRCSILRLICILLGDLFGDRS